MAGLSQQDCGPPTCPAAAIPSAASGTTSPSRQRSDSLGALRKSVFEGGLDQPTPRLPSEGDAATNWKPVYRIVLTGGPCAGKTTSLSRLRSFLENRGFFACVLPETSTLLRTGGIDFTPQDDNAFQNAITTTQAMHETVWYEYALRIALVTKRPAVILLDRGLLDGSVYVPQEKFQECLRGAGLKPDLAAVLARYDAVFHLVSAADGAVAFYETSATRYETVELAVELDHKLRAAWASHPHHYVFKNHGRFEDKLLEVVHRLCELLNLPDTTKSPRKFVLDELPPEPEELPTADPRLSDVVVVSVIKTYLKNAPIATPEGRDGEYTFVRRRKQARHKPAYVIKMVRQERGQRIERKQQLTKRQYLHYLDYADPDRHVVRQRRICFSYQRAFFQIDEYIEPSRGLVLVNVYSASDAFPNFPSFLVKGKEVTHDLDYSAHRISLRSSEQLSRPQIGDELRRRLSQAKKDPHDAHAATAEDLDDDDDSLLPPTRESSAPKRSESVQDFRLHT